jgi:nitroreductase
MTEFGTSRSGTNDIWEAIYTQRAVRYWEEREVPQELLWRIVDAATHAPNGSNRQLWRWLVLTDPAKRGRIAAAVRERVQIPAKWIAGARDAGDSSRLLMYRGSQHLFDRFDEAPALIVPCQHQFASATGATADSLVAGASIYGAVQNLQLAARALGLGTVLTTAQVWIGDVLRSELGIPEDAQPAAVIPVGYPAVDFGPTRRKPVEEVTFWNGWGVHGTRKPSG